MAEKMLLIIPVSAEKRDEFIALANSALPDTRAYDGCLRVEMWTPDDDNSVVWLYEEWESRKHQEAYFNWRIETGFMDALAPFLSGEPRIAWLKEH